MSECSESPTNFKTSDRWDSEKDSDDGEEEEKEEEEGDFITPNGYSFCEAISTVIIIARYSALGTGWDR